MTEQQYREFKRKAESDLRGHQGLRDGRDYRWNSTISKDDRDNFRGNFDAIFPGAPGRGI